MTIFEKHDSQIAELYHRMHPELSPDEILKYVRSFSEKHKVDIPCSMHNNSKNKRIQTTVSQVMSYIDQRQPIITGNGTFVKQHSELTAPTVKMLESLQLKRGVKKDAMFKCTEGSIEYKLKFTGQLNVKIVMNAEYGGAGTPLSPFYNQYVPAATTASAKVMTTTLICCLEMLSGNTDKWAKIQNVNGLYDFIHIVLTDTDERNHLIHDTFSVDEVCDALLGFVHFYTVEDMKYLKQYLSTLTNDQLTKLRLAFQVKFVLERYLSNELDGAMEYLKSHQIDWNNITKETLQIAGFGTTIPAEIESYVNRINEVIIDNCCYPFILNDNEVRAAEMQNRLIVCITDTDSLMVHFSHYVDEFHARVENFRDSCIIASALGMRLFVENIIPRMVKYLTIGCNIKDEYYRAKFVFKNEFGFLAQALIAKKMYASSMFVQEGSPRDIHDIAVSGLSFKKRDSAEFLEPIMVDLYDRFILTPDHVSVKGIMDEYYALREKLKNELDNNPGYYQVLGLKDVTAYDPNKILPEQMRGALVWNEIMPDEQLMPMDRVIVVRLSFEKMQQHVSDDPKIAEVLRMTLINNEKMKDTPFICLPEHYKEIPEWIRPIIDKDGMVDKLLTPFKQMLSLFDIMVADTKAGAVASRMICP